MTSSTSSVPLILWKSRSGVAPETLAHTEQLGAFQVLVKPVDRETLIQAVDRALATLEDDAWL